MQTMQKWHHNMYIGFFFLLHRPYYSFPKSVIDKVPNKSNQFVIQIKVWMFMSNVTAMGKNLYGAEKWKKISGTTAETAAEMSN